ncbi:beta-N-acetylhexosaminidase [Thermaurantiacus sp.]
MIPAFFGLSGLALTDAERRLFDRRPPAGYILFRRNIDTPEQVRALTDELRARSGNPRLPILVDQEGGRVARLQPPSWPAFPPASRFADAWEKAPATAMAAARANAEAIGRVCAAVGITVDCLPLLDVRQPGAHDIIGDRALGSDPLAVAALGRAVLDGLQAAGVVGVVKHVPGHGRAMADSHLDLPLVDASEAELEIDLSPFIRLSDAPMAMTAHILYPAWDERLCASLSPRIIGGIIRGRIGFDGLLMSDDLGMKALAHQPGGNAMGARAAGVVAAGCDIALHCSGDLGEMEEVADALDEMGEVALKRLNAAMAWATAHGAARWRGGDPGARPDPVEALCERRDALLAAAAG